MDTSEASHAESGTQRAQRSRQRPATSCTECRRRKQKCNQARDRPCNNCLRRYPPVECVYEISRKISTYTESVIDFKDSETTKLGLSGNGQAASVPTRSDALFRLDIRESFSTTRRHRLSPEASSVALKSLWGSSRLSPFREEEELSRAHIQLIHDPTTSEDSQSSRIINRSRIAQERRERCKEVHWGILENYVGNTAVEPLHALPIRPSRRNAELLHLFTTTLSPYIASLDGKDPPANFQTIWVPFLVQSPLTANLSILTAAYFIAAANKIDIEKSPEVIESRLTMVSVINGYLRANNQAISDEAIVAVISFSYNEWIYANEAVIWAHMKGLREMLKLRGGLRTVHRDFRDKLVRYILDSPPLIKLRLTESYDIFKTDYQIACAFECPLFLHRNDPDDVIPVLEDYQSDLDSPLLQSNVRFVDIVQDLGISIQAATVLDDMRFLTTSALTLTAGNQEAITQFLHTTQWIHQILTSPNSSTSTEDFIYASVLAAAEIYTTALLHHIPFSRACTQPLLTKLWMNMWRVPLTQWKRIPGIFLWIVFLVLPFARDKAEGRFIKAMTAVAIMTVALRDWEVCVTTMRALRAVQGWLGGVRGLDLVGGEGPDVVESGLQEDH